MPLRLNAFAVFAFAIDMARLPGHWSETWSPLNALAQTMPSRRTMAAHSWFSKPPFAGPPLALTLDRKASRRRDWSAGQSAAAGKATAAHQASDNKEHPRERRRIMRGLPALRNVA